MPEPSPLTLDYRAISRNLAFQKLDSIIADEIDAHRKRHGAAPAALVIAPTPPTDAENKTTAQAQELFARLTKGPA